MTVPPVVIDLGTSVAAAARVLDHERLKRLPVVDGSGRLAVIVSRADLLGVFLRDDEAIEREIREHVLLRTLWTDSTGIAVSVHKGVVTLSGVADTPEAVDYLGRLCAGVPGVAEVRNAVVATTKGSRP